VTWEVAVAGTVHCDDITTPRGRMTSIGGSALYFALAASRYAPVRLNGIVGADSEQEVREQLAGFPVTTDGLEISRLPTVRWHAVHDFETWVTASERTEEGCDPAWRATLSAGSAGAEVLFLASMHPAFQRRILEQSNARLIAADSMLVYIDSLGDAVREIAERCDVLFLNQAELAGLTRHESWVLGARALCGHGRLRAVVVTRGPDGAACVTANTVIERPAIAVPDVVDPTGGGDAVAGGFLGLCAQRERDDELAFVEALETGVRCAAAAISTFGPAGLRSFERGVSVARADLHRLDDQ